MITNKTSYKLISEKERLCDDALSQSWGLMFRRKQNLIMIFPKEKIASLHMFFVFYPIDVLIVDGKLKIIEIKKKFKPFTLWKSQEKGKYIIELAYPTDYKVGDKIIIG